MHKMFCLNLIFVASSFQQFSLMLLFPKVKNIMYTELVLSAIHSEIREVWSCHLISVDVM